MTEQKDRFIQLLVESGALLHGNFKLKSGRRSPYFIDFGRVADGHHLLELGKCYADRIASDDIGLDSFDIVFGPAYKAIPIATATAMAIKQNYGVTKRYAFNRKVKKSYGDKRQLVGTEISSTDRVLIVDDVFVDGGAKLETIEVLKKHGDPTVTGVLVGVNRAVEGALETFAQKTESLAMSAICSWDEVHHAFGCSAELKAAASRNGST